jgi:hypothetical protein
MPRSVVMRPHANAVAEDHLAAVPPGKSQQRDESN